MAPLDQFTLPAQPLAVSVAFSSPHTFSLSAVTAGAAGLFVVPMVMLTELAEVPQSVVQVTVYVPLPTWILLPVAPLDQFKVPEQPLAVKVAFSASQTAKRSACMLGAFGFSPEPMVTGTEASDLPQLVVQVA